MTAGTACGAWSARAACGELNAEYIEIARRRIASDAPLFSDVATLSPIASVCAADDAGVCAAPHLPEAA